MTDDSSSSVICPYSDKDCPKINHIEDKVELNERRLWNIERLLYAMLGMIAINSGLILWR